MLENRLIHFGLQFADVAALLCTANQQSKLLINLENIGNHLTKTIPCDVHNALHESLSHQKL